MTKKIKKRSKLCKGVKTRSDNYVLYKKITNLNQFWKVINNNKSIFARHKMYPSAFFFSWNIKLVNEWIKYGYFWETKSLK
jgi:hypothetical protein